MAHDEPVVVGGRYELLERIGSGGQAEVWRAADRRLNGKQVAVKRLFGFQGGAGSSDDLERARREAYAASRLDHPNLVAVTDFVAEGGQPYIVMEYVAGRTLEDAVTAGGLPVPEAARLIGEIAGALAEAHAASIVHRDIKPANILVNARGSAKLTDFGIARSSDDPRLTSTGMFTGTVAYLAPELLDGSEPSGASDVWSLAATLFELIEGRKAFAAPTVPALLNAIVQGPLPVPQRSRELAPLLTRMLDRDPLRRPGAVEVAALLAAAPYVDTAPEARVGRRDDVTVAGGTADGPADNSAAENIAADDVAADDETRFAVPTGPVAARAGAARPARRRRVFAVGAAVVVVAAAATGVAVLTSSGGGGDGGDRPGSTPPPSARAAVADGLGTMGSGGAGTYTIGVQSTLTGDAAFFGEPILNAVRLAAERVNARSPGFRIAVTPVDDVGTADGSVRAADALVRNRSVVGIVGPISSPMTINVGPIYAAAGLAVISPAATATELGQSGFSTFHLVTADDDDVGRAAGAYLTRVGPSTLLVVDDGIAYGRNAAQAVRDTTSPAAERSVTLPPTADAAPTARLAVSIGADAVFYGGNYSGGAKFAKALTAAGYTGLRLGVEAAARAPFVDGAGASAEGWTFAAPVADPEGTPLATFVAAYRARFGTPPQRYAAEAFDATNALIESIRFAAQSGSATRDTVEQALDAGRYRGVLTSVSFDAGGHARAPRVWLWRVTDGVVRAVGDIADLP